MNSHHELSRYLQQRGVLKSAMLIESFNAIDRKDFVSPGLQDEAYEDHPLAIGAGQTISQPYTVAFMLELLQLEESDRILDVGCGSGWSTALLAQTAKDRKSTRLNSSHVRISYAVFCLKKKKP